MRNMSNREIDGILSRIKTLKSQSSMHASIAEQLIDSMCAYTSSVFEDNYQRSNSLQMRENANSISEYQRQFVEIDSGRKIAHDALITMIKMADFVCRKTGIPEIYGELPEQFKDDVSGLMGKENRDKPGVVETRHGIANWTWGFITGAVISMDIDIEGRDYSRNMQDIRDMGSAYKPSRAKKLLNELTEPDR